MMLQKIATALNQRVKMSLVSWNPAIAPQLKKRYNCRWLRGYELSSDPI
jgi:hypothetical protein